MGTIRTILNGAQTLTFDPSPRLRTYQKKMAERDRAQREEWARMLSRASRQESRENR